MSGKLERQPHDTETMCAQYSIQQQGVEYPNCPMNHRHCTHCLGKVNNEPTLNIHFILEQSCRFISTPIE